ncbi:MAG TPA: trypsin-like peptidase domain-containing protein [Actinomycetota bacterium]|nr:trypsin-like peptidase domain-containing protein [Actinomycetota bacterium]
MALALAGTACDLSIRSNDPGAQLSEPLPDVSLEQSNEGPPTSTAAEVVEKVLPSVVNVRVTALSSDPITGDVREGKGQGSGVVIDRRGVIVTNNHVVQTATEVTVVLNDGRRLTGSVVDTDPEHDLAVVRVDADDLTPIEFGRSESLRLGDDVIALGFPLGLVGGPSVTKGIVSALDRRISVTNETDSGELSGLIQTDAAINPGNSGGALVDLNGRLVGINTAAAGAASAENVGFAINIDSAIPIIKEILTTPPEKRPWMGVILGDVEPAQASELGLPPDTTGALITQIIPGSPAEDAGLEEGDVVTAVNGEAVGSAAELIDVLTGFKPEDVVELEVVNPDGSRTVDVTLEIRPPAFNTTTSPSPEP